MNRTPTCRLPSSSCWMSRCVRAGRRRRPGAATGRRRPRAAADARAAAARRCAEGHVDHPRPDRRGRQRLADPARAGPHHAPEARESRVATTDQQGRFEIKELPAGRYTMTASKGGFVALQYGQRRPSESGTPIELGDGQTIDKIAIALPRGSVLGGRITDEFGEPVANASVSAWRYGYVGRRAAHDAGRTERARHHRRPGSLPPVRLAAR